MAFSIQALVFKLVLIVFFFVDFDHFFKTFEGRFVVSDLRAEAVGDIENVIIFELWITGFEFQCCALL